MEINPQSINPDYQVSSLDPCPSISRPQDYQTVYSCSGFPIEPYQQLYPFQSGTSLIFNPTALYDAEIISGTDYAYFERVEYIDSAGNFYPYETFGTLLSGLTGAELSGTGNFIGYEGAGTFERENSTVYRVRFDNYSLPEASVIIRIKNLNDNTSTDWHTLIVNPDLRFVNQQNEADTLLHYYSKDVTPKFINANSPCAHPGYGGCPPDNVTFSIEVIEGQQYGSIKNFETNEIATSYTGLSYNNLNTTFTYYANGVQPDSTATVRIRHSSNDPEIIPQEFSFTIKKNNIPPPSEGGSIYVKMDKQIVIPGDTVNVKLLWIDAVGDTVEFSQIQRFKVDLAEGSEYGTILDAETGETSDTFTEITNEFKVIVAPQIEPETAKIVLVAEADLIIFTRPIGINNGTDITKQLQEHTVDNVDDGGGTNTDVIIIGNHLVGVGEITITKTPFIIEIVPAVVSAGDTAQIIPMKLNPDGTTTPFDTLQTFEIGMLDGCPLGYLSAEADSNNYFYGVTQPFYFIADSSADSGTVNIRVGVIETNQQNRSLTNNNNIIPESDNPVSCANVSFEENLYANANVVVGNECDFDNCGDSYDDIQIQVVRQINFYESGYFVVDSLGNTIVQTKNDTVCFRKDSLNNVVPDSAIGQSRPLDYHRERKNQNGIYEYAWYLKPCKNASGKIELRPVLADSVTPTPIYIDFMADVCYTSISNDGHTLINNTTQLSNTTLVPDTAIIAKDICGHSCYPQLVSKNGFIIKEIVERHELLHMEHFKRILSDTKKDSLVNELKSWATYTCQDYNDAKNKNSLDRDFLFIIQAYFRRAENQYWKESGYKYFEGIQEIPSNRSKIKSNEENIHYVPAIYDLVDKYHLALHNARGTAYPYTTCAKCPK